MAAPYLSLLLATMNKNTPIFLSPGFYVAKRLKRSMFSTAGVGLGVNI
jgi:hypothetical protein